MNELANLFFYQLIKTYLANCVSTVSTKKRNADAGVISLLKKQVTLTYYLKLTSLGKILKKSVGSVSSVCSRPTVNELLISAV